MSVGSAARGRLIFPTSINHVATRVEREWKDSIDMLNKTKISGVTEWVKFCEWIRLYIQRVKANVWYFGRLGASSCSDIFDEGQVQQLCLLRKTQTAGSKHLILLPAKDLSPPRGALCVCVLERQ